MLHEDFMNGLPLAPRPLRRRVFDLSLLASAALCSAFWALGCSGATTDGDGASGVDASASADAGSSGGHGGADAGVANPDAGWQGVDVLREDFAELVGDYASGDRLGAWTVVEAGAYAQVIAAQDEGITGAAGDNVLRFTHYDADSGFGDNRLDRCERFEPDLPLAFSFQAYADLASGELDDVFRVRVNPNFYADLEACEADVAEGETERRLEEEGAWYNEDFDTRLLSAGALAGQWTRILHATHGREGEMKIKPQDLPPGAQVVRFSLRLRDRGYADDPSRRLYVDDLRLWQ
jgi:hypothetical protein